MSDFFTWVMGLVAAVIPWGHTSVPTWNGYVEEDYSYASAPSAGTIESITVAEGQLVRKGDVLFVLEASQQQAQYDAAKARANAAEATLANLQTGSRQEEVDVTRASLQKGIADRDLAQQNLQRSQGLFARGLIAQAKLDQDKATLAAAQAAVDQLEAQLKVAVLPARDAQQIAAEANLVAAKADTANAKAALDNRTVVAPEGGRIERLFFKTGEVAGAGVSVMSLSGADALKVKFYVNEGDRSRFALGQQVSVTCDGCPAGLTATISHFASDPQFTPPIIYSRDERNRLVFLTEATMDDGQNILPGQPVSVGLLP